MAAPDNANFLLDTDNTLLDNITRELLNCRKLQHNCAEFSLPGLMSIPAIFDQAIRNTAANYDAIHRKVQ